MLAERLLVPKLSEPESSRECETILEDTVLSFPILNNLHVDIISADGSVRVAGFYPPYTPDNERALGQNHSNRWHAWLARETSETGVRFSPVIMSVQKSPIPLLTFAVVSDDRRAVVSGSLKLPALFSDLTEQADLADAQFVVLDPNRQIIYPQDDKSRILAWPHDAEPSYETVLQGTDSFVTEAKLDASGEHFPDWTVIVAKPQTTRVAALTNLQVRTVMFGIFVILFTIAAGVMTVRPIRRAMAKLERDLKNGSHESTIQGGPEEFREYQNAYREVRSKLEERSLKLSELNRNLETLVEQRSRELTAEEFLFRQVFYEIEDSILLVDTNWILREMNRAAEVSLTPEQRSTFLEHCRTRVGALASGNVMMRDADSNDDQNIGAADATARNGAFVIRSDANGEERSYECRLFPFTARRSDLRDGFCLLIRDVTKRERLEQMKENLIGIVAHELKTPITTCRLQLEALEKESGASVRRHAHVERGLFPKNTVPSQHRDRREYLIVG